MSVKNALDQYYTNPDYAKECMETASKWYNGELYVEPCAGTGSFFNLMPEGNRLGMDLEPKCEGEGMNPEPQDFLQYLKPFRKAFVVSNPPFGKNSTLAIQFFNHCALLGAEYICFVIPKTFRKASVINKLDRSYELIHDEDSPLGSFILDDKPYDVPCCFQVWKLIEGYRDLIPTESANALFEFVPKGQHDFVVRRAGGRAGRLIEDEIDSAASSNYFLKSKVPKEKLRAILKAVDLSKEAGNTAGVKSVAKYELVNKAMESQA